MFEGHCEIIVLGMTTTSGQRLNIAQLAPEVYKAMIALDSAARKGLDPTLVELVLTRASQLNHCAWCLDMHTRDAREAGVTEQKLYLLNAWRKPEVCTPTRSAQLALTEAVTVLTDGFVPDAVYNEASEHFADAELAQLISVILTINAWNRIAVTSRMAPPVRD